jgi:hypothetical protein
MLNALHGPALLFSTWQDIGDVKALSKMKREHYITRSFNKLEFREPGIVRKTGNGEDFWQEITYLDQKKLQHNPLFPRFYGWQENPLSYDIEYIDSPSLAELYLYWPGRPDMWAAILEGVLNTLNEHLWRKAVTPVDDYIEKMYVRKTIDRLNEYHQGVRLSEDEQRVVNELLFNVIPEHRAILCTGHGDLNFGNILYSLSSMTFKLIDPRGDQAVDVHYEFAKLRYSYADGFNAICHGLYDIVDNEVVLGPKRDAEIAAMDEVMERFDLPSIKAIEACIFLSAAALHQGKEGRAMYLQGLKLAREVTGE